jgi:hypothetical protein
LGGFRLISSGHSDQFLKENNMRLSALGTTVLLALAVTACGTGETPAATTAAAAAPTNTQNILTPTPTTPLPTDTPSGPLGSISGNILPVAPDSGPTGATKVGAREVNTGRVTLIDIPAGQTTYILQGLMVGTYNIIGWIYPDGVTGAYTKTGISTVKTSSEQLKCNNSLEVITLGPGNMDFTGADIGCWAGDYYFLLTPIP